MHTFILILALTAGAMSKSDSSSMVTAEFSSKETCTLAGKAAVDKFETIMKSAKFICVEK